MKIKKAPEQVVVEAVKCYLEDIKKRLEDIPSTPKVKVTYSIKSEYEIQMGASKTRADVVLLKRTINLIEDTIVTNPLIIVECKALGNKGNGIDQLKGYLCARDTPFGILAEGKEQGRWKYYKNHGGYKFDTLPSRKTFETQVTDRENSEASAAERMTERINQAIGKRKEKMEQEYKKKKEDIEANLQADFQKRVTDIEANLQADFQKRVTDLAGNQQKPLSEARKDSFKNGFWVGAISIVILVVVVAIVASGG